MTITRRTHKVGGITITTVTDVKTPEEIRYALYRPGGPGDKDLKRRADAVAQVASATAPVGKTGELARGFFVRQARTIGGQFDSGYEVGNTAPHFVYVVKGTRPHEIVGNPLLVFDWPKGGKHPAVFRRVHHPGTTPNPFFINAVKAAQ